MRNLGICAIFFAVVSSQLASGAESAAKPEIFTELHIKLCGASPSAMIRALEPEDAESKERDVYFIDSDDLSLYRNNVIIRVRGESAEKMKLTVKIRNLTVANVEEKWFRGPGFKCEVDRYGDQAIEDCSLTEEVDPTAWRSVKKGKALSSVILSSRQQVFLAQYGRFQPNWESTRALGPISSRAFEGNDRALDRKISVEYWRLPKNEFIVELSTRASHDEADQIVQSLAGYAQYHGVAACNPQIGKTAVALQLLRNN